MIKQVSTNNKSSTSINKEDARAKNYKRMGEMPIKKLILTLSTPSIVSMMISSFYSMADTYFVSMLGTSASAAVGVIFPLMAFMQAIGMCLAQGAGVYISRLLGEAKVKRANEALAFSWYVTIAIGIIIAVAGILGINTLVRMLGATETILPYAVDYCSIILYGAPVIMSSFVMNTILKSEGNSFFAMIGIGAGAIINIALDPLFIFTFNMGISGAALATIISQSISFAILLSYFVMKKSALTLSVRHFRFEFAMFIEILKMGLPSLFRQGLTSISMIILNNVAAPYGDYVIAAVSIVTRIAMFATSVLLGFGQGFQPVAGYNYGAKKYKRLWDSYIFTMWALLGISFVCAVVFMGFSEPIVAMFRKDDPMVISLGSLGLFWTGLLMPVKALSILVTMTFQALGKGTPSSLLSFARQGLALIPAILILPYFLDEKAIPIAQPAADLLAFVVLVLPYMIYLNSYLKKLVKEETQIGSGQSI